MIAVRQSGQDKEQPLPERQALPEADSLGMIRLFQGYSLCLKRASHHTAIRQTFARMAVSLLTERCVACVRPELSTPFCCGWCIMQCS